MVSAIGHEARRTIAQSHRADAAAKKELHLGEYNDRGLLWNALTSNVPTDIANSIGAALGCTWPDMHSDCLAIKRHFHPELEEEQTVANDIENSVAPQNTWSSGALATLFLYDKSEQWVQAMVNVWASKQNNLNNPTMEIELPLSVFD